MGGWGEGGYIEYYKDLEIVTGFFTISISIGQLGMATIIRHIYP